VQIRPRRSKVVTEKTVAVEAGARFNPKTGKAEVKHGAFSWHWACARHRSDEVANASHMKAGEGYKGENAGDFKKALNRVDGYVTTLKEFKAETATPTKAVKTPKAKTPTVKPEVVTEDDEPASEEELAALHQSIGTHLN
jgi:hypothetical protein